MHLTSFPAPLVHAPHMPRRACQRARVASSPSRLPGLEASHRTHSAGAARTLRKVSAVSIWRTLERRRGRIACEPGRHEDSGHSVPKVARAVEQVVVRDLPIDRPVDESHMCSCQCSAVRRAVAKDADVAAASACAYLGKGRREVGERLGGGGLSGSGGDSRISSPRSRISSTTMISSQRCVPEGCTLRPDARVHQVLGAILLLRALLVSDGLGANLGANLGALLVSDGRLDAHRDSLRDSLRDPERLVRDARVEGK